LAGGGIGALSSQLSATILPAHSNTGDQVSSFEFRVSAPRISGWAGNPSPPRNTSSSSGVLTLIQAPLSASGIVGVRTSGHWARARGALNPRETRVSINVHACGSYRASVGCTRPLASRGMTAQHPGRLWSTSHERASTLMSGISQAPTTQHTLGAHLKAVSRPASGPFPEPGASLS